MLAAELNRRMEDLLHGDTRWLASAAAVVPVPAGVPGGITSEEEEAQLESLNEWMEAAGCPRGVVAYGLLGPAVRRTEGRLRSRVAERHPGGAEPARGCVAQRGKADVSPRQSGRVPVLHRHRRVQALRHRRDPRRGRRRVSDRGESDRGERRPGGRTPRASRLADKPARSYGIERHRHLFAPWAYAGLQELANSLLRHDRCGRKRQHTSQGQQGSCGGEEDERDRPETRLVT